MKQKLLSNLKGVGVRSKAILSCKAWFCLNLVSKSVLVIHMLL
jgi:hypothetical protein